MVRFIRTIGPIVAAVALSNATMSCKKSEKKDSASAPATATTQPTAAKLAAKALPADVSTLVVQPSQVALNLGLLDVKKDSVVAVEVYLMELSSDNSKVNYTLKAHVKVNAKGQAPIPNLADGYYDIRSIGSSGKTLAESVVQIAAPSGSSLHLLDTPTNHTFMSSPNTNHEKELCEQAMLADPAAVKNKQFNITQVHKTAKVLGKAAKKSGKATSPDLIKSVGKSIAKNNKSMADAIKNKKASLWANLLGTSSNDPTEVFGQLCQQEESVKNVAPQTSDVGAGDSAAEIKAEAAIIGDDSISKLNDAQTVVSQLQGDDLKALQTPLIEDQVLGGIAWLGNATTADGAAPFKPDDKALFAAISVVAIGNGDTNKLLDQIGGFMMAADPSKLPASSDELASAWIALAQGKFESAMASIRSVQGGFKEADKTTVNTYVGDYLQFFKDFAAFALTADSFYSDIGSLSDDALAQLVSASDGSATGFYPGGACSQFAALSATEQTDLLGGTSQWPEFCYLTDSSQTCDAISPDHLVATAASSLDDSVSYCDYRAFIVGKGQCSALAALDPWVQNDIESYAMGITGSTTLPGICVRSGEACSTFDVNGISDGSTSTVCDYTAPAAYVAKFEAGGSCADLIADWNGLSDYSSIIATMSDLSAGDALCTDFAAPDSGFPASCEQFGYSFGANITTDGTTCVYTAPETASGPDFIQGGSCADMQNATNKPFISMFVSSLSLANPVLCTDFSATSAYATCPSFGDQTDESTLQVKANGTNCELNTGSFTMGTGTCTDFHALSAPLQEMYAQAAEPGQKVCTDLASSGVASCSELNWALSADGSGNCEAEPLAFTPGDTCANFTANVDAANYSFYVSMLSVVSPTLCTSATSSDFCTGIDSTLTYDADGNCSLPPPTDASGNKLSFTLGGTCADLIAMPAETWSSYVGQATQANAAQAMATVCTGFAVDTAAGVNACSDIDSSLAKSDAGDCVVQFPYWQSAMSCTDFYNLPLATQTDAINNASTVPNNATLCTAVADSAFGTCTEISTPAPGESAFSRSVVAVGADCKVQP